MSNHENNKKSIKPYLGWVARRLALVLFDIFAVNISYFLAIYIRFFVNGEFHTGAGELYLPVFYKFAPWYTILCIGIFAFFRLYDSRWKNAGLHDLNRISVANAVTCVVHIAGTLLFFARMPITYYFIGALIQFVLIVLSRFSYSFLLLERSRLGKKGINVMIVGVGETANVLRRQLENNNLAHPVCILCLDQSHGNMIDGIPVVKGIENLQQYVEKYKVQVIYLADTLMKAEDREKIKKSAGVEVQDFSAYLSYSGPDLTLRKLLEYSVGPVEIKVGERVKKYSSGEEALLDLGGNYKVVSVSGAKIEIAAGRKPLDTQALWVKEAEAKGEDISFF